MLLACQKQLGVAKRCTMRQITLNHFPVTHIIIAVVFIGFSKATYALSLIKSSLWMNAKSFFE